MRILSSIGYGFMALVLAGGWAFIYWQSSAVDLAAVEASRNALTELRAIDAGWNQRLVDARLHARARRSPASLPLPRRLRPARGEGAAPGRRAGRQRTGAAQARLRGQGGPGRALRCRARGGAGRSGGGGRGPGRGARHAGGCHLRPGLARAHRAAPRHAGAHHRPQLRRCADGGRAVPRRPSLLLRLPARGAGVPGLEPGPAQAPDRPHQRPAARSQRNAGSAREGPHTRTVGGARQAEGVRGDADPEREDVLARPDGRGHRARGEYAARLRQSEPGSGAQERAAGRPPGRGDRAAARAALGRGRRRSGARRPVRAGARAGGGTALRTAALGGAGSAAEGRPVRHRPDLGSDRQPEELQPARPQQGRRLRPARRHREFDPHRLRAAAEARACARSSARSRTSPARPRRSTR